VRQGLLHGDRSNIYAQHTLGLPRVIAPAMSVRRPGRVRLECAPVDSRCRAMVWHSGRMIRGGRGRCHAACTTVREGHSTQTEEGACSHHMGGTRARRSSTVRMSIGLRVGSYLHHKAKRSIAFSEEYTKVKQRGSRCALIHYSSVVFWQVQSESSSRHRRLLLGK
jgi:hypothetical protein